MKVYSWLVAAAMGAVVLSACGSSGSSSTPNAPAGNLLTTEPGSIGSDWVTWDKKACKYVPASSHPASWTAELRKPAKPFKLGFGEQGEGQVLLDAFNQNMKDDATKVGIPLFVGNYNTLNSSTDVVTQAQAIALRNPDIVVSFNVLTAQLQAVNSLYSAKCIPIIQITAPAPNTIVFGASNSDVGKTEGGYLAAYAKKQNWDGASTVVMGLQTPSLGAEIGKRITDCETAVSSALSGVKVDNLPQVASNTADAQTKMTDWLTAHPTSHHVLVCTISDIYAIGVANALKGSNRAQDGAVVGAGGGSDATSTIKAGGPMIGTVDFGWGHYADYLIPLAEDVLSGKVVPTEIHQKMSVLDKTNIS